MEGAPAAVAEVPPAVPELTAATVATPAPVSAPKLAISPVAAPAAATATTVTPDKAPSQWQLLRADLREARALRAQLKAEGTDAVRDVHATAQGGDRSQVIALLLVIFLGVLGIHRFYLGYPVIGVIQLLTAGGFGIWWIIDLIRIIFGGLGPKNGSYY